ncbi:MAG: class I SAM-dependent methyltransferase [Firmicutes bacterium]|nr:class I SAM-dependent methyltransferase [Bacillota bacterium]
MERTKWIIEKRKKAEERYDTIFSSDYDDKWGYIEEEHEKLVKEFIEMLPDNGHVLDAACGTGKYWNILRSYNLRVKGIDQSYQMLSKAGSKCKEYEIEKMGLQDIKEVNKYNGIMCVDALENIFPEDWVKVIRNFYNALKNEGILYFTVETISKQEKDEAFAIGKELGLPIAYGEVAHEGGYHYYPEIKYVKNTLENEHFTIVKESVSEGYHHFLVNKR